MNLCTTTVEPVRNRPGAWKSVQHAHCRELVYCTVGNWCTVQSVWNRCETSVRPPWNFSQKISVHNCSTTLQIAITMEQTRRHNMNPPNPPPTCLHCGTEGHVEDLCARTVYLGIPPALTCTVLFPLVPNTLPAPDAST